MVQNLDVALDHQTRAVSLPGQPERSPHPGERVGVLLCHGFTGSPASMVPWGTFLNSLGYAVEVPRLPGHGTTWQEMNTTRWEDWYGELCSTFDRLLAANDRVVLAGLSMGGALSLRLAADRPKDVTGLLLVNPAVTSTNKQLAAVPLLKWIVPAMPGIGNDVKKSGADEFGYDKTPLKALDSMRRAWPTLRQDLSKVTAPLRLFRSTEDHVVDPSSARMILASAGSSDKQEILLHDSFHVATIDNDAPLIFDESARFIEAVTDPRRV